MKRLDTKTRQILIKEAVLDIISTEGISKLSTKNIALKVGVTEGAIYRHFKSKKAILLSIINDVYKNLVIKQQDVASSNLEPEKKLFTFFCKQIQYLIKNKGITILLFTEAAHANDSELKKQLLKILKAQKQLLIQIVQEGIDKNVWDKNINLGDFATLYMGIPVILNIELVLQKEKFKSDKFCTKMFILLIKTLK
ncbi:TetR/AcrR family transcriptional regulator [Lutibacter sp.]|uniref:TetR/AcrR family transcriptional regulator n=1 Tax=Lutibacter sp. TaxID=1925666 RepID=UPI0025C56026|nr:TetR/AcrR family transcriptional regulator [Lutibacter sp.]MCF6181226.1 TetR/AcrR family transcriptional regulator [Lutibacter sp.]